MALTFAFFLLSCRILSAILFPLPFLYQPPHKHGRSGAQTVKPILLWCGWCLWWVVVMVGEVASLCLGLGACIPCTYTVVGWSELVLFANFETKISTILVVQFKKILSLAALAFTCVFKFACSKNRVNIKLNYFFMLDSLFYFKEHFKNQSAIQTFNFFLL